MNKSGGTVKAPSAESIPANLGGGPPEVFSSVAKETSHGSLVFSMKSDSWLSGARTNPGMTRPLPERKLE